LDSAAVNRELRAVVRPALQTHGFSVFTTRSAWRYGSDRIEVVNFQSFNSYLAAGLQCTTYSFSLNLGIYLCAVPTDHRPPVRKGHEAPDEAACHLRRRLERGLEQPELARHEIWYVDPAGAYLSAAVQDARRALLEDGLEWFAQYTLKGSLLTALTGPGHWLEDGTHLPGNPDSPARNLVTGYVARSLGASTLARHHLARALEQYQALDQKHAAPRVKMPRMTPSALVLDVAALDELEERAV
jgi:hypothetical protein